MKTYQDILKEYVKAVIDVVINIGPCRFRLVSNIPDFVGLKYFSQHIQCPYSHGSIVDFELFCVSLEVSELDPNIALIDLVDNTCRGKQFLEGYYVTDHFGPPAYLVSKETSFFLFGWKLEKIVWSYFVKYFLQLKALKDKELFLKATAISVNSHGTLLLGRGGAGKTVFLSDLCLNGAEFISNSHVIVHGNRMQGVASSMRIRKHAWNIELLSKTKVTPGTKDSEVVIDPYEVFSLRTRYAIIRNICILNYKHPTYHVIQPISYQQVYDYAEQFALGLNVYRLEEDVLDHYHGDTAQFSESYRLMKKQLWTMVHRCNCYFISSNVLDSSYRSEILRLLSTN